MFEVKTPSTVANVTDLRRNMKELFERLEKGDAVVIQRNADPVAVMVGPEDWKDLQETRERLAEIEQVVLAMVREKRIERGETETLSHGEMMRRLGMDGETAAESVDDQ